MERIREREVDPFDLEVAMDDSRQLYHSNSPATFEKDHSRGNERHRLPSSSSSITPTKTTESGMDPSSTKFIPSDGVPSPSDPEPRLLSRLQRPKPVLPHIDAQAVTLLSRKFNLKSGVDDREAEQHLQLHPVSARTLVDAAAKRDPSPAVAVERELGFREIGTG